MTQVTAQQKGRTLDGDPSLRNWWDRAGKNCLCEPTLGLIPQNTPGLGQHPAGGGVGMSPLVPHDFSDMFLTSLKSLIPCLILGIAFFLWKEDKYNNTDATAATSQNSCKIECGSVSDSVSECRICDKWLTWLCIWIEDCQMLGSSSDEFNSPHLLKSLMYLRSVLFPSRSVQTLTLGYLMDATWALTLAFYTQQIHKYTWNGNIVLAG